MDVKEGNFLDNNALCEIVFWLVSENRKVRGNIFSGSTDMATKWFGN